MKKTYEIIKNEEALKDFIDWLPQTENYEQYYVALFSRKKYAPDNEACSYDKTQLKRFTSSKELLLRKIRQLECPVGSYLGKNNLPIPQESLALYISLNPRDFHAAFFRTISEFAKILQSFDKENCKNPHQEVLNVIQTSNSLTRFHVFDIDTKSEEKLKEICSILGDNYDLIETRGGYHVLVHHAKISEIPKQEKGNWYVAMKKIADVVGDCLTPIPGTTQGNFIPKLLKIEKS